MTGPVVTFDLFSALLDSRTGGSAAFGRIAHERGWRVSGEDLYDRWDTRNKQAQQQCAQWVPYADLAREALRAVYRSEGLDGNPDVDVDLLLHTLPDWPLWPDVSAGLPSLAGPSRPGILSNVDDELLVRTRAAGLVDPALALTSQRLRAYKPARRIYERAREMLGPMVHVATSARDVRGALEAGLTVVRLRRPGHELDPDGPRPPYEAGDIPELRALLGGVVTAR